MVFELLGARIRNAFTIQMFARTRLRRLLKKIERGEAETEGLLKEFEKYQKGGVVEEVESSMHHLLGKTERDDMIIFDMEEQTVLRLLKEFTQFYESLQEMKRAADDIHAAYPRFSSQTQMRIQKMYREIITILEHDAEQTYTIMLQFARAFRDQYDALLETKEGNEARERLREMIVGVAFQNLTERLNLRGSMRAAKRLTRDIKEEEKSLHELRALLSHLGVNGSEERFVQSLDRVERIIRDENVQIDEFLSDTRIYLFLVIRHYFVTLGHLLKVKEDEKMLEAQHFPASHLRKILQLNDIEFAHLQKRSQGIMREGYQLYHTLENLKSAANDLKRAA